MKKQSDKELVEQYGVDEAIRLLADRIYSNGCLSYEQAEKYALRRVIAAFMKK